MISLSDVWDFHTDIRCVVLPEYEHEKFRHRMLDLETCSRMGGVFSATRRYPTDGREAQWAKLKREVAALQSLRNLRMIHSAGDLNGAGGQLLHAEGIYFIQDEQDLGGIDTLWNLGFRSLAPMYNEDNALGGGAKGDVNRGLTRLGAQFVTSAWKRGFIVDCAHSNHRTKEDLIDVALEIGKPLHYSHGHLDAPVLEYFGQRGVLKSTATRIAKTGGLIGLSPHPGFHGYFARYLEEIAYLADLIPAHAAFGSDFPGITTPPVPFKEFPSGAESPAVALRIAAKHGDAFARGFFGQNLRCMLESTLPRN